MMESMLYTYRYRYDDVDNEVDGDVDKDGSGIHGEDHDVVDVEEAVVDAQTYMAPAT